VTVKTISRVNLRSIKREAIRHGVFIAAYLELITDESHLGLCIRRSVVIADHNGEAKKLIFSHDEYFWHHRIEAGRDKFRDLKRKWSKLPWSAKHGYFTPRWSAHRKPLTTIDECKTWGEVLGIDAQKLFDICVGDK
jgi:hypothetical protein